MSSRASKIEPGTPLGKRLLEAIVDEGWAVKNLEDDLAISAGHLGRIIRGERWRETVDLELAQRLAKRLHVNFAWLVIGEGPKKRGGREPTPAETAIAFARKNGVREDAVQIAWERNKDREAEMTELDWVLAINGEAAKLRGPHVPFERPTPEAVPRPEEVRKKTRTINRMSKRKKRALERVKEAENAKPVVALPGELRVVGHDD